MSRKKPRGGGEGGGTALIDINKIRMACFCISAAAAIAGAIMMFFMTRPRGNEMRWWKDEDYKRMTYCFWLYVGWAVLWIVLSAGIFLLPLAA